MLPKNLALIDDDAEYTELLSKYLQARGIQVVVFGDSNDLLTERDPYRHDFYIVDLNLPGVDGVDLIKLLRRRSDAGLLVISGRQANGVFQQAVSAGADMYLTKPVPFEQIASAIEAVQRRAGKPVPTVLPWRLDRRARQLESPEGARVDLSETDVIVLECFVQANGAAVTRETLHQRLGTEPTDQGADGLNATIYRLRRRVARSTTLVVPLQSKSRVGYVFRAPLTEA